MRVTNQFSVLAGKVTQFTAKLLSKTPNRSDPIKLT